ncbi:nucleoside-diphosphate-sugar epimerase [Streptomyces rishiriensis]|uniref:Nucleoside-diphosphate-sugar epimerase n=1 Tax=Streptomyces rishiriensis TaxID=68264 RepID=A0ABU0NYT3_STRRH|nr:nucleoside-diphosphate-sugar epimerase [Streptomyces rishiriensis]
MPTPPPVDSRRGESRPRLRPRPAGAGTGPGRRRPVPSRLHLRGVRRPAGAQRETYWGNVNPVGPRSVYDESKRFAEALVTAHRQVHGTDTAIVRIFNTYGPRMRTGDGRAVPAFISQAMDGIPLTVAGDGSQTRSLCYVDDTVDGVLALAASGEPGPVNIGGGVEITVLDLARRIVEITGSSSRIRFVERPVDDPGRRRPDTRMAQERLGWQPRVDWTEGLGRTIGWFTRSEAA